MKIYLVRHGQTESNAGDVKQGREGFLSDFGKQQIKATASALSKISVDKIICSPYDRAKQTAEIISESIPVSIEYSPLFEERKNPTEIIGINKYSDLTKQVLKLIEEHVQDSQWHYSDEENFHDLVERSKQALNYLESFDCDTMIVVSHGYFIGTFLLVVLLGDQLNAQSFYELRMKMPIANASISEIELVKNDKGMFWRILSVNNRSHLIDQALLSKKTE